MIANLIILILVVSFPDWAFSQEAPADLTLLVQKGNQHFQNRAEGAEGDRADPKEIDQAISAYRQALALDPSLLTARGRLLRALYFKTQYTTFDKDEKKRLFGEGTALAEETLNQIRKEAASRSGRSMANANPVELAPFVKDSPGAIDCFLWSAATWGSWAQAYGMVAAVREGLASKIRDLGTAVMEMDPNFAGGGGYRILGRLHHLTPRIPFMTGWVSDKEAIRLLRLAVEADSIYYANRLYLAEALWDQKEQASRQEAVRLLEGIVNDTPRPEFLVEEKATQKRAAELLSDWKKN